ncbi:sulfite exporter TauE/SafE family protein [Sulfuricurvum sp.]|uniref:sulfite exporter TauE/SafE family protein n=1 Tax=Sulfuricurvum sp. TaxID=2025608 RepID=UPI0026098C7D|nr:sulfite exporter TauE/SafE family protein [Sulfuricurvum sp.]MDD2267817.1 sulfite exporter TauE/SafE family protein [Sulfuricurvum sp.]MDD2783507.1 sulfite exporter TauE/SafE family protein [Sulfuricurvum sp.]
MHGIEWWLIVSIAFAGSFGHCIGMCGGFIVAYSSTKIDASMSRTEQFVRHGAYNLGRVSSYAVLGMVFGAIGSLFALSMEMHGVLFIFAGIIMIITALGMFGLSKLIHVLERGFSSNALFKALFSRLIKSKSIGSFFALGVMNGFFPCGFVFFFAAKAAASASILKGGLIMAVFGLATVPTLLALGQSVSIFKEIAFRQTMNRIAALAILIYGLYSVYYGLAYFFDLPI